MKSQEAILYAALILAILVPQNRAFDCGDGPIKNVETLLEIIGGRLMAEGMNSVILFHRQAVDSLKYSKNLIQKYSPDVYKQALREGRAAGSDSKSATILDEVGLYRIVVECSNEHLSDFLDTLIKGTERETCKNSITTLEKLLGSLENAEKEYYWLNLLRVKMTQQCDNS